MSTQPHRKWWKSEKATRNDIRAIPRTEGRLLLVEMARKALEIYNGSVPQDQRLSSILPLLARINSGPMVPPDDPDLTRENTRIEELLRHLPASDHNREGALQVIHLALRHAIEYPSLRQNLFYAVERMALATARHSQDPDSYKTPYTLYTHIIGPTGPRFDPSFRTPDAVNLAREIVQTRNLDLLPILADALQDAGYNDETTLNQLRHEHSLSTPAHWVIRQLLG